MSIPASSKPQNCTSKPPRYILNETKTRTKHWKRPHQHRSCTWRERKAALQPALEDWQKMAAYILHIMQWEIITRSLPRDADAPFLNPPQSTITVGYNARAPSTALVRLLLHFMSTRSSMLTPLFRENPPCKATSKIFSEAPELMMCKAHPRPQLMCISFMHRCWGTWRLDKVAVRKRAPYAVRRGAKWSFFPIGESVGCYLCGASLHGEWGRSQWIRHEVGLNLPRVGERRWQMSIQLQEPAGSGNVVLW